MATGKVFVVAATGEVFDHCLVFVQDILCDEFVQCLVFMVEIVSEVFVHSVQWLLVKYLWYLQ